MNTWVLNTVSQLSDDDILAGQRLRYTFEYCLGVLHEALSKECTYLVLAGYRNVRIYPREDKNNATIFTWKEPSAAIKRLYRYLVDESIVVVDDDFNVSPGPQYQLFVKKLDEQLASRPCLEKLITNDAKVIKSQLGLW